MLEKSAGSAGRTGEYVVILFRAVWQPRTIPREGIPRTRIYPRPRAWGHSQVVFKTTHFFDFGGFNRHLPSGEPKVRGHLVGWLETNVFYLLPWRKLIHGLGGTHLPSPRSEKAHRNSNWARPGRAGPHQFYNADFRAHWFGTLRSNINWARPRRAPLILLCAFSLRNPICAGFCVQHSASGREVGHPPRGRRHAGASSPPWHAGGAWGSVLRGDP